MTQTDPVTVSSQIMIIAGEASGDSHAAKVAGELKKKCPGIGLFGIGGEAMEKAGVEILVPSSSLSVVGITEVLFKLPAILNGISVARHNLEKRRPGLLILVDFPDFNLFVATYAKRLKIPVLYYISPQIWAWRKGRIRTIGKKVDHMAVILPFEKPFYRKHGIPATFVGHPLLDRRLPPVDANWKEKVENEPIIGLLPGSREGEVMTLLPEMLKAAGRLSKSLNKPRFLLSAAPSVERAMVEEIISGNGWIPNLAIVEGGVGNVLEKCGFAIAASGTVTLETAIHGIPLVVVYKVSPVSYRLGKAMIKVDHISLVNLIAGKPVVPELIQDEASGERIAENVRVMLSDIESLSRTRDELLAIRHRLGMVGAAEKVARLAMSLMNG